MLQFPSPGQKAFSKVGEGGNPQSPTNTHSPAYFTVQTVSGWWTQSCLICQIFCLLKFKYFTLWEEAESLMGFECCFITS